MPSSEESGRKREREIEREREEQLHGTRGGRETANTEKTTDEENKKKRRILRASHTKPEELVSETKSKRDEKPARVQAIQPRKGVGQTYTGCAVKSCYSNLSLEKTASATRESTNN